MSGYVFDTTSVRNADNYTKTKNEIARHVGSTSKYGGDLRRTIEKETVVTFMKPTRPRLVPAGNTATPDEQYEYEELMDVYREDMKAYVKRKVTLDDNMSRAYEMVWGQCSNQMRAKVEADPGYTTVRDSSDLLGLLKLIKLVSFDFHSQKSRPLGLLEVEKAFKNFRQRPDVTTDNYHEKFIHLVTAYE